MYLAMWVVGCTLPGVLIWRALTGPSTRSTIVAELGFGSVLGIVLQLLGWAVATALHQPLAMLLLPAGVAGIFALVPKLRRLWWPRRSRKTTTPVRWHVTMAAVCGLAVFAQISRLPASSTPPELVSADLWYNSALAHELSRTLRPQDPFVLGEPLRYHWFADAHVTATAQLSGVLIVDAIRFFWLIPMIVVVLLAVAAAAQKFMSGPRLRNAAGIALSDARRWWVGPLAAFFTWVAAGVWQLGGRGLGRTSSGFISSSPSAILGLALILALVGPVTDLLRGRSRWGTWVILLLLLACSVGTKPSVLPVVAFGAAAVVIVQLVAHRRLNWRMLILIGVSILLIVVASPVLAGSVGGSRLQLLAFASSDVGYAGLYEEGDPVLAGIGGWLLPALADGVPYAVPVVAMIVALWILIEIPRLLAWAGLTSSTLRSDPALGWAIGVSVGGCGAMWVVAHSGYSQHHFWTGTVALSTVVTVTSAVRLIPAATRVRALLLPIVVGGALPAALTSYLLREYYPVELTGSSVSVLTSRLAPYGILLLVGAAVIGVFLLARANRRFSLPILTVVTAFVLGAAVPAALVPLRAGFTEPVPVRNADRYPSTEQAIAAQWLEGHSDPEAVVATNMFCWPMDRVEPDCPLRFTWLGGIGGRRMVLGNWSYSQATQQGYTETTRMTQQPSPWPERLELSREVVTDPTWANLGRLRRDYQARWLIVDTRASEVSPRLAELTTLAFSTTHVRIYRLRTSYGSGS